MNVGQIWECELWLAGYLLKIHYGIAPFREKHPREKSQRLRETQQVFSLFGFLKLVSKQIIHGLTQLSGKSIILLLIHKVDEKIQSMDVDIMHLLLLRGRAKQRVQRVG
ncbi:unnamed protein product [Musa acuminata subsp. malaccensis]|nr:unnamed protein product [Musa acuminata subsp. malaccensis]